MDDIWFSDTPLWMDSTTVSQFLDAIEGNGVYIFRLCINFDPSMLHKGQLISKCLFCVFNSSKKRTKNFFPSRLGQKLKFSSLFFGSIEDTKMSFRN